MLVTNGIEEWIHVHISRELLDHFDTAVLKSKHTRDIPTAPNVNVSVLVNKYMCLKIDERFNAKSGAEFKQEMSEEQDRDRTEVESETDKAAGYNGM